jgi:hypothetical protein
MALYASDGDLAALKQALAGRIAKEAREGYGWIPHNAGFGFLDLAPSILHSNWF